MKPRLTAAVFCLTVSAALGRPTVIGTAIAPGTFRIDNTTVRGNATLLDGSVIESALASPSVQIDGNVRFSLGAESRGRVFGSRIELEKGSVKLEKGASFQLAALGLSMQPGHLAAGVVAFDGARRVQVSATRGAWQVRDAQGQVIANLPAGVTLWFEPQSAADGVTRLTGVLKDEGGRFLLTDEVTRVTVEVIGPGVAKEVGKRIEVQGLMEPATSSSRGAARVLRVRELHSLGKAETVASTAGTGRGTAVSAAKATAGQTASAGTAAAAGQTAGAAAGGAAAGGAAAGGTVAVAAGTATAGTIGAATISTVAIIGGIAVGGVVGGVAAAASASENQLPESR